MQAGIESFLGKKVEGVGLVYSLMIGLLITLVLGGMIMLGHYQRLLQLRVLQQEMAWDNLVSAQ